MEFLGNLTYREYFKTARQILPIGMIMEENEGLVSREVALSAGTRIFSAAELGNVIRTRRKELGYTQVQIAEMTGFSTRLVGEIEHGRGSVGFDRVLYYAINLGIDFAAFVR